MDTLQVCSQYETHFAEIHFAGIHFAEIQGVITYSFERERQRESGTARDMVPRGST